MATGPLLSTKPAAASASHVPDDLTTVADTQVDAVIKSLKKAGLSDHQLETFLAVAHTHITIGEFKNAVGDARSAGATDEQLKSALALIADYEPPPEPSSAA